MEEFIRDLCKDKPPDFLDGFERGCWAFAHWKDGVQYVGTTGNLFSEVQLAIWKIKNNILVNKKEGKNE